MDPRPVSLAGSVIRIFMRLLNRVALSGDLARQRRFSMTAGSLMLLPRGATIRAEQAQGIPLRWVTPAAVQPGRLIYFLHGGGWVFGLIPYYNLMLSWIARACRAQVVALEYRLAPEHPYPAALEDCLTVYRCLLQSGFRPQQMAFLGDSAGGNLVLTTMLAAREQGLPLPAAGVCLSPVTDLAGRGESYVTNRSREALLPESFVRFARASYLGEGDPSDPLVSPVYADLSGLPPLLVQAGGDEILLSDAQKLVELARQAGVDAALRVYPGMWHVFQTAVPYLPEARAAITEIGAFVHKWTT